MMLHLLCEGCPLVVSSMPLFNHGELLEGQFALEPLLLFRGPLLVDDGDKAAEEACYPTDFQLFGFGSGILLFFIAIRLRFRLFFLPLRISHVLTLFYHKCILQKLSFSLLHRPIKILWTLSYGRQKVPVDFNWDHSNVGGLCLELNKNILVNLNFVQRMMWRSFSFLEFCAVFDEWPLNF